MSRFSSSGIARHRPDLEQHVFPGHAQHLGRVEMPQSRRDDIARRERSAFERYVRARARYLVDLGLVELGASPRWPEAQVAMEEAKAELDSIRDLVVGAQYAALLLEVEDLDAARNDPADSTAAQAANNEYTVLQDRYGAWLRMVGGA